MSHPARHNISQAAKMAGVSRRTLQRHIDKGKVSCSTDESGNKFIDTSELLRVYGDLTPQDDAPRVTPRTDTVTHLDTPDVTRTLREQVTELQRQLQAQMEKNELQESRFNTQIEAIREDSRKREDRLLEILDRQTLLLTHIKDEKPEPPPARPPETTAREMKDIELIKKQNAYIIHTMKLSWWERLLGKKYVVPNDR